MAVFDVSDSRPLNFSSGKHCSDIPAGGSEKDNEITGLAWHGGLLYVSLGSRGMIAVNDAETGAVRKTIQIEKPGSIAVAKDGTVLVVCGNKIMRLNDNQPSPLIAEKLDEPTGVAVGKDGVIYVANRGRLQNISVFSPDGKFLRSVGKAGGRPKVGRYEKDGMLEPGGIAVDAQGRIWVAETLDSPKRVSVWNPDGAPADEFFGAAGYFGWAWMDDKRPDELYCHNTIWKVDWTKNSCYPFSTIWRATSPNMVRAAAADGYAGHLRVMTARSGKQFAWGMSDFSGTLYMRDGDIFKPIAGVMRVANGSHGNNGGAYPVVRDAWKKRDGGKQTSGAFLWQDKNNDQIIQEDELEISAANRGETSFNWIDGELNAWCDAGWIYKPVRFEADGRPVYDFSKKTEIPWKGSNANGTSLWLDNQDDTVYTLNPGRKDMPNLARWTRDGRLLWGYGAIPEWQQSLQLPLVTPGKLHRTDHAAVLRRRFHRSRDLLLPLPYPHP